MAVINVGAVQSPLAQVLGVVSGAAQGFDALRQQQQQTDLQTLELLSKNPNLQIAPASPDEAQLSPLGQRLLGGPSYQPTAEGYPVVRMGPSGIPLTVKPQPSLAQLMGMVPGETSAPAAPSTAPSPAPERPITQTTWGPGTAQPTAPPLTTGGTGASPAPSPVMRGGVAAIPAPGSPDWNAFEQQRQDYIEDHPLVKEARKLAIAVSNRAPLAQQQAAYQHLNEMRQKVGEEFVQRHEQAYTRQQEEVKRADSYFNELFKASDAITDPTQRMNVVRQLVQARGNVGALDQIAPTIPSGEAVRQKFQMDQKYSTAPTQEELKDELAKMGIADTRQASPQQLTQAQQNIANRKVAEKPLEGEAGQKVSAMDNLESLAKRVEETYKADYVGPKTGRTGEARKQLGGYFGIPKMEEQEVQFRQSLDTLKAILTYAMAGARGEAAQGAYNRLAALAPSYTTQPEVFAAQLKEFQRYLPEAKRAILGVETVPRGQLTTRPGAGGSTTPPAPGTTPTGAPQSTTPTTTPAAAPMKVSEADIQATVKGSGRSRDEVVQALKTKYKDRLQLTP